jgi:hypothetical protein
MAAQIAAEEYGGDVGDGRRGRPISARAGGSRISTGHQMSQMLDCHQLGWQAQMAESMVRGGIALGRAAAARHGPGAWWEHEDEGEWASYDGYSAGLLESGYLAFSSFGSSAENSGDVASSVQVAGGHLVDLASMRQHDARTGLVHNVRRREVSGDSTESLHAMHRTARAAARASSAWPAVGSDEWRGHAMVSPLLSHSLEHWSVL